MSNAAIDQNSRPTLTALSNVDGTTIVDLYADPITHRLLVDLLAGSGTVTTVSVTTANGISGSVANPTTAPAITLTLGAITPTTVNGLTITSTTGTFSLTNGKTLSILKTISFTAADDTGVYTLPTGTKTLIDTTVTTLSSLVTVGTLTSGTASTGFVVAGVTMTLGSDASYDTYYRGATGVLTRLANGTTGQVLTATTSAAPSWSSPSYPTWSTITGTSQNAPSNISSGYITNNAGLVTIVLPVTAPIGTIISLAGLGAGGWELGQNALQLIHFGNQVTTTGINGKLDSTNRYDTVTVVCTVANTTWSVISSVGNLTVA